MGRAPAHPVVVDADRAPDYAGLLERAPAVLVRGDAATALSEFPAGRVQTVVTSPPYWSLRDYGIAGQIGLEGSVDEFLKSLVKVFDQVWRVLRDDGTLWLNIGDSYTSGGRTWRAPDRKNPARGMEVRPPTPDGLKPKDLVGIPWRLALALQAAGWYLRADIVWYKPNCQPESVRDRPTRSHEFVFLLTKSERYRYNLDAVPGPNGRRLRTVWDINTRARSDAYFAAFPPGLVENCIRLGTSGGELVLDPFAGSGTTGEVAARLGRAFVGVELNPDYLAMAERRIAAASVEGAGGP